ncbi:MAG TPA: hypothetical protein VLK65_08070 [Vicinamibacteria bacterium]|nr:hypothetical protein [Vicinamibacteria bacterium]
MEDRLSRLESEVESISRALKGVEERLDSLERKSATAPSTAARTSVAAHVISEGSDSEIARVITFIGRTLLVLGGGYLLRSLTESGTLAPLSGVSIGLLYALFWLGVADRAGANARTLSAAFHGASAVLVAYPLLWETTVRFQLLSPPWGAGVLAVVSGVAVSVAWRQRLLSFAWVTVVGAMLTSVLLLVGTRDIFWFSLPSVLVGVATLWLSYHADWHAVRWVGAGVADATVALVGVGVLVGADIEPAAALLVQLSLFALFLSSFAYRVWKQRRDPGAFELVQTGLVVFIGYGGALMAAPDRLGFVLASLGIAGGMGSYAIAFRSRNLSARSTDYVGNVGLALLLLGSTSAALQPTLFFSLAAVALSWFGSKLERPVFCLHGAAFVLAAAISSGLVQQAAYAFFAPAGYAWPPLGFWVVVSLVAAISARLVLREASGNVRRLAPARTTDLLTVVAGLGAILLSLVAPRTSGQAVQDADAAALAMVRTAVLALSAVALGLLGRSQRFPEAPWLAYAMLVAGAIKLAVEDFPQGRALTLFVGLAVYGGALILAPRRPRSSP